MPRLEDEAEYDEDSDLTPIEEDELDDEDDGGEYGKPPAKSKGKKKAAGKAASGAGERTYKIRRALKVPRAVTYTAQSLFGPPLIPFLHVSVPGVQAFGETNALFSPCRPDCEL